MSKLVVLKFGYGGFEQGFPVTLQIGDEDERPSIEITGKLPPAIDLPLCYSHWQSSYKNLDNRYRLDAAKAQVTNVSITQNCHHAAQALHANFNNWLKTEEFRPIREKWLERLLPIDEVRVVLQTENSQLQRLPWHLWDLLERYPKAEIALASPTYERIEKVQTPNAQVKILAILGNSQGINTQADKALLEKLPSANVRFLIEPQRQKLTDCLWGEHFDILFFAGHSSSHNNDETGRIHLNSTEIISIDELRLALRKAVESGLQLAIFNSCDGLGLAWKLADLQIPQMIVMREPVPDQVAQEFLKYFLNTFANGEPFYLAVRQARERLQAIEDKFPCATWLPVICQNLAQMPPTWDKLKGGLDNQIKIPWTPDQFILQRNPNQILEPKPEHHSSTMRKTTAKIMLLSSLVITALVGGVRFFGWLQTTELQAFDQMMRSRSIVIKEEPDPRLLVVTINDADIAVQRQNGESLKGTSLSDQSLNKLLEKLEQYQPRVIGLDIYRDFPTDKSHQDLIARLQQTQYLIGVCKGSDEIINIHGIEPPPEIPLHRLGFSDFIHDADGVVRRHLLFMNQHRNSSCQASYSLSALLAFRYLLAKGIQPNFTPERNLQLGTTVFNNLLPRSSGYQGIDANGGQVFLNYRSSKNIAQQVTLTEILSGKINSNALEKAVKDKIVLIGVTAKGDFTDYSATPYGNQFNEQISGVLVQAQMVSQILSAVEDNRPLLSVWSLWIEVVWIWGWSVTGGILAWRLRSLSRLALSLGVTSGVLYLFCFALLIQGAWVPFVPSVLALVATGGTVSVYQRTQQTRQSRLKSQVQS